MKIKKEELKLLNDTIKICLENEFYVRFPSQATMKNCCGWVNNTPKQFTVCFPKQTSNHYDYQTTWGIFLHESCHLDQIIEKSPLWFNNTVDVEEDYLELYCIKKKIKKSKKLLNFFKKTLELELDCERRAIEKIEKYNLNIDKKEYIKKGNIYLKSYYSFYYLQTWYNKNLSIYNDWLIYEAMPDFFYKDVDKYWKKTHRIHEHLKNKGI